MFMFLKKVRKFESKKFIIINCFLLSYFPKQQNRTVAVKTSRTKHRIVLTSKMIADVTLC